MGKNKIRFFIIATGLLLIGFNLKAQTFSHYTGHANTAFDSNGMQQVSEVHYYYYVPADGSGIQLALPIQNYFANGNDTEPRNYFRWYDYNTDKGTNRLAANGSQLRTVYDANGTDRGLVATNLASKNYNPSHSTVGVIYNPPKEATQQDNWQGEVIACDVSRYNDFGGTGGEMKAEPTLSVRYIFHIKAGKQQAESIVNASSADRRGKYGNLTIEDNKRIIFGMKDGSALIHLRTDNPQERYFFYRLKQTNHHVYAADSAHLIKAVDFDTSTLYQSNYIYWRVYDPTRTMYTDMFSAYQQIAYFSMTKIQNNGNGWKTLDGKNAGKKPSLTYGSIVYIVAFARHDKTGPYAPIANFKLQFVGTYPKTRQEVIADGDNQRMVSYLSSHYQAATKPISFDDDNSEQDLQQPTSADNNMSRLPSKWDRRTYGFTYYELKNFTPSNNWWQPHTPLHGEYGLYKSANVKGISDFKAGYKWWVNNTVYDRTYELTGGKQYGYFLYVDASDESRQIAAADFKANLCAGTRLIFTGAVADFTSGGTKPEVMFKLYGITRDENDEITDQQLITSFSSGDLSTNTKGLTTGKWYQVYTKLVLPKNSGVDNYTDFRIVMDNMCMSTAGADYLIDDLHLYIQPDKVDVLQSKPVCPDQANSQTAPNDITLKIRAKYESIAELVGNKASKLFYRFCDLQGNPVSGIDYNGDGTSDAYGTAEVPAQADTTMVLPAGSAGGSTQTKMFETDSENDVYLVIANRHYDLQQGKQYYLSVAYPDEEQPDSPGTWGKPTNVCSTYSQTFEIVKQNVVITDANGNVVTDIRVSCDANRTPNVNINARLSTADLVNGGSVELTNIAFDWFFSENGKANDFTAVSGLQEALRHYRDAYPDRTDLVAWYPYKQFTEADYQVLKTYVDNHRLLLSASNKIENYRFEVGNYSVAAIPIASTVTTGNQTYEICPDPMYFNLRVLEDGPKLTLGFKQVAYPTDDRTVRIGLPQLRAMVAKGKYLQLPIALLESAKVVTFNDSARVFVSNTNDPTWNSTQQVVGKVVNAEVTQEQSQWLNIAFDSKVLTSWHEGYWYELNCSYQQKLQTGEQTISCPGNLFVTFKVVPEYLTWNSSPENALNANWNNDLNWLRSTAKELYKPDYTDYGTEATCQDNPTDRGVTRQRAFTPMKFSKVTIADQTGKVYPDLNNITYRSGDKIATKLVNDKGEGATDNIAYDMCTKWTATTDDHSDTGDGVFSCETFKGNLCDQLYLKPHTEILNACYLAYNKTYAEKELSTGQWYLMASPLHSTYAGDMYAPKTSGRQETEAFVPIRYDEAADSRTALPVYQRNWDRSGQEVVDRWKHYEAYHYDDYVYRIDTISDASLNIASAYWSHSYNKIDESYEGGKAFAVKVGDAYTTANNIPVALLRLPKDDDQYAYYNYDGTASGLTATLDRNKNYRLLVDYSTADGTISPVRQTLEKGVHAKDKYRLIGNPYTASLSMYLFLKANTMFENKVWTLEGNQVKAYAIATDAAYNRSKDVLVEPMQAFIVKEKEDAAPEEAYFTTQMTVDRWLTGGTGTQASDAVITLSAQNGSMGSCATVTVKADANSQYDEAEDAELLECAELSDIPQVYTVASDRAVSLNTTTCIDLMPIGVVANSNQSVNVNFSINAKMKQPLWLLDSQTLTYTPITAGSTVSLMANNHGRYYLTTTQYDLNKAGKQARISCYQPTNGQLTVGCIGSELRSVSLYHADGTLAKQAEQTGSNSITLSVSPGIYIVKAITAKGQQLSVKVYAH